MFALLYSIRWFDGLFKIFILMILNLYHVLRPSITAVFWPLLSEVLKSYYCKGQNTEYRKA